MEKLKSPQAIALAATALLLASLVWLMNTRSINNSLVTGLENQKLKSEQLLSEKLQLEKEMERFKDQLFTLKDKNLGLDNLVNSLSSQLQNQQEEYNRMKKEKLSIAQIKKQKQGLLALQNQLQNDLETLRLEYASLQSQNKDLTDMVAILEERNRHLADDLNKTMHATLDRSHIQALKGKSERLTIRARKTRKILATFEVPSDLRNLNFRIVDSRGNVLTPNDGTTSSVATPAESSLTASANPEVIARGLQKVEVAFTPKKKLATGIYTVEILNENLYVGSVKVKLR